MMPLVVAKLYTVFAAGCSLPSKSQNSFFGFPHWWQYLNGEVDPSGVCTPVVVFPSGIWAIGIAVLDMLLYLAGIAAVVSILISGLMYVTSSGSAEKATSARRRIVNSLIGLAIVVSASVLVSFVGNKIG